MSEEEEDENKNLKPQTSLNFTINNPQIVVQNEIKGSALLLICKEPIKLEFNNYYFNLYKCLQIRKHFRTLYINLILIK